MDKLLITGPSSLSGSVQVSRAKNAYLPILIAVLLSEKPVHLKNIPNLRDINTTFKLLQKLGVQISRNGNITTLDASRVSNLEATYDLVKTMRASILVLGPLLSRFKRAKVSLPGGCAIGTRPIDIHLNNLKKLGAEINLQSGYVEASTYELTGTKLVLSFPSVGATENLMMAAVFASGTTIIENAALEPEIDDLANFLVAMGVSIDGIGTTTLTIQGVPDPSALNEVEYEAIGDRIEAATYIIASLITNSEIIVEGFRPTHLDSVINTLKDMGAQIDILENGVRVRKGRLCGCRVDTAPFPGFPTDVQAQISALCTQVQGPSIISENIFENRFMHVPELCRLGAKITLKGNAAIVEGDSILNGAPVMCTDLRASAALVIAALAAHGTTEIQRVYHIDRGYEQIDLKLKKLGVDVVRINEHD